MSEKKELKIEFFNKTSNKKLFLKLQDLFEELLDALPSYSTHIKKLGIFIAEKIDKNIQIEAIKYTEMPTIPWKIPDAPMSSAYYKGIQAISISYQHYINKSENEVKHHILHELVHGILGHSIREISEVNLIYKKYFQELQQERAFFVINILINFQRDFEVDCFLSEKFPKFNLEAIFSFSKRLSLNKLSKRVKQLPLYAQR